MSQDPQPFSHHPVLVELVTELLVGAPAGLVVDATVGGGGHARALLAADSERRVLGLDRDPTALAAAADALADFGDRVVLRHARFDTIAEVVASLGTPVVAGVLFDLGVSSPQFDRPDRGFSYRNSGPLDMRMDPDEAAPTAGDVVNGYEAEALARIFAASGETRWARRIAARIVAARPLSTTTDLAEVVRDAIPAPARRRGGHPARRVFQALRIEVNRELDLLPSALEAAIELVVPGGRCVVLSYHSGEDRIVKDVFTDAVTGGCTCPPGLPCGCGAVIRARFLTRGARKPSAAEVAANPRAESARLRAIERLAAGERATR